MTHGAVRLTPAQHARKRALWQARNTAYRRLAVEHPEEFRRYKEEYLAEKGHPPLADGVTGGE